MSVGARASNAALAPSLMLLSALTFSFEPLLIVLAGGSFSPFMFNAAIKAGYMAAYIPLGLLFYRRPLLCGAFWRMVWERRSIGHLAASIANNFFRVCYAAAARFIDVAAVSVALGAYPALCAALIAWLFRRGCRYAAMPAWRRALFGLCFIGFALVALAETGGARVLQESISRLAMGFGLSALGAALLAASAFQLRWGALFGAVAADRFAMRRHEGEFLGVSVGAAIGNMIALGVFAIASWILDETMSVGSLWLAIGGGAALAALGEIPWRIANLRAIDVGVNVLSYSSPLFGLVWLYGAGLIAVARLDWLVYGAALIFARNALCAAPRGK